MHPEAMALLHWLTKAYIFASIVCLLIEMDVVAAAPNQADQYYKHTIEIPIDNFLLYQLGISHGNAIDHTNVESVLLKTLKSHKVDVSKVDFPSVVRVVIQKLKNMLLRLRKC